MIVLNKELFEVMTLIAQLVCRGTSHVLTPWQYPAQLEYEPPNVCELGQKAQIYHNATQENQ